MTLQLLLGAPLGIPDFFGRISSLLLIFVPSERNLGHRNCLNLSIVNKILVSELKNCLAQTAPDGKFPEISPSRSKNILLRVKIYTPTGF